jgi:ribonuclease P protein component
MRLSECVVFVVPNEKAHFRLGITMKARGTSIERNNVKRRIREGFRTRAPLLGAFDYNVVVPGSKKMAHPYELRLAKCLDRELESALSRLRT